MALSNLLTEAGHAPELLRTHAVVRLRNRDGEISLSRIDLDTVGQLPGLAETEFQRCRRRGEGELTVPFHGRSQESLRSR